MSNTSREKKARRRRERLKRREKKAARSGSRLAPFAGSRHPEDWRFESNILEVIGMLLASADETPPRELLSLLREMSSCHHPLARLAGQLNEFLHRSGGWSFSISELLLLEDIFIRHHEGKTLAVLLSLSLANVPGFFPREPGRDSWPFGKNAGESFISKRALLFFQEAPESLDAIRLFLALRGPVSLACAKLAAKIAGKMFCLGGGEALRSFEKVLVRAISCEDLSGPGGPDILKALEGFSAGLPSFDHSPEALTLREIFGILFSRRMKTPPTLAEFCRTYPHLAVNVLGLPLEELLDEKGVREFLAGCGKRMPGAALRIMKRRFNVTKMGCEERLRYEAAIVKLLKMIWYSIKAGSFAMAKGGQDIKEEIVSRFAAMADILDQKGDDGQRIEARLLSFYVSVIVATENYGESLVLTRRLLSRQPQNFCLHLLAFMGAWKKHPSNVAPDGWPIPSGSLTHVDSNMAAKIAWSGPLDLPFLSVFRNSFYLRMDRDQRLEFLRTFFWRFARQCHGKRELKILAAVFCGDSELVSLREGAGERRLVEFIDQVQKVAARRLDKPDRKVRKAPSVKQCELFGGGNADQA